MAPLRTLVVAYLFPPVGGGGVGRMTKLVKYLPAHDVAPVVLTVENPSVPVLDPELLGDVPAGVEIVRVRTFEPGYGLKQAAWSASGDAAPSLARSVIRGASALARQALVPDPQILWQPRAQAALARRLLAGSDDAVLISGPPFSQFLLAPLARLRRGTAVVLDYRDEWSTYSSTYEMMGGLGARVSPLLESGVLRAAHVVTTATEAFRDNLLARFPSLDPARVLAIPNGYDPDDFPASLPVPAGERFVLTYGGTVFKLTSARGLLGAVRRLHEHEPELARSLQVRFIGRIVDTEKTYFEGTERLGVTQAGFVAHQELMPMLAASHMVACLLDDVPGVDRIYPAKIFELMYLGRPVLTLAPAGVLADLVAEQGMGRALPPRDEVTIATRLADALRAFRAGTWNISARAAGCERFHRRALAGEFAAALRQAVEVARRGAAARAR